MNKVTAIIAVVAVLLVAYLAYLVVTKDSWKMSGTESTIPK
jgi:hypothetical protein